MFAIWLPTEPATRRSRARRGRILDASPVDPGRAIGRSMRVHNRSSRSVRAGTSPSTLKVRPERPAGTAQRRPTSRRARRDLSIHAATDDDRAAAYRVLSTAYRLGAGIAGRLNLDDLAWTSAERALEAAPLRRPDVETAISIRYLAWTLIRQGRTEDAERVAIAAAEQIQPTMLDRDPTKAGVFGNLLFNAASAALSAGNGSRADDLLAEAHAAAMRSIGDTATEAASLGPRVVALQKIDSIARAGGPETALHLVESIPAAHRDVPAFWEAGHRLRLAAAAVTVRRDKQALAFLGEGSICWMTSSRWGRPGNRTGSSGRCPPSRHEPERLRLGHHAELASCSGFAGSHWCARSYLYDTVAHMRRLFDELVARASDHHGYVTTRDARELGIDPTQLRLMAARGRLERAGRGVYRVPVLPRTENDELAAAVAWSMGRAVVSHESALVLHGLTDVNPPRIHLTVPRDNPPRAQGGELYRIHRRVLPQPDVAAVDGLPVTTVKRTIIDCIAAGVDPYQLRRAVDRAEADGALRPKAATALREMLDAAGRRRRKNPWR